MYKTLGPRLLERVYEKCLKEELEFQDFKVETQRKVKLEYRNVQIETELRLDLLVNDIIIVKIKSIENLLPVREAQLLTYMSLLENLKVY